MSVDNISTSSSSSLLSLDNMPFLVCVFIIPSFFYYIFSYSRRFIFVVVDNSWLVCLRHHWHYFKLRHFHFLLFYALFHRIEIIKFVSLLVRRFFFWSTKSKLDASFNASFHVSSFVAVTVVVTACVCVILGRHLKGSTRFSARVPNHSNACRTIQKKCSQEIFTVF